MTKQSEPNGGSRGSHERRSSRSFAGDQDGISGLAQGDGGPSTHLTQTGSEVRIAPLVLDQLRRAADRTAPEECCGLLLGRHDLIVEARAAENVAADRRRRFEIDPQALVDAHRAARSGGPQVLGYYHSHPVGPAEPSPTDAALSAGDGSVWAIVGETGVTFWRDGQQGFEPLSYTEEAG